MAQKIEVVVTGDTRDLERALSKGQKSASNFEKGLKTASKGALVALGALGVGAVASVKAASDLEEQINKTSVVFRGSEDAIHAWSETTASSFGISQRAALEAAGTFGNMLVPMGLARDRAGEMSTRMVELASDMASFNNADPTEVLDSLRAGLSGETEPLRRFGVFLNEARIKQQALSMGLIKGKEELTASAKAQATYAIILKDTGDAQGDFADTSDSLANQQRILKAELENTAAALGTALLPAATGAAGALLDLVHWTQEHETAARAGAVAVAGLSAAILVARASVAIYTSSTLAAIGATKGLRLAMAATPWGLAAVAASGLVAWIISQGEEAGDASVQQDRLTDAVRDYQQAIKAGNDARKEHAESSRRVEGAEIAVKRAVQARAQTDRDATSTALDKQEADLRVSNALAELRDAEDAATASGTRLRDEQLKQVGAQGRARASVERLAEEYKDWKDGMGRINTPLERLKAGIDRNTFAMHTGRTNAERYADKLRQMAAALPPAASELANTARMAARLADAWGRVVSLPAARSFVARFSVITTVETNRVIPTGHGQHGGIVTRPTVALIGEAGPEAVVPLHRTPGSSSLPSGAGMAGGGVTIIVQNHGLISSPDQVVNLLRDAVARWQRTNGKAAF